jgi:FkbM family methyltransferase
MTDDEMTVLLIAAQGESMIPIGRWAKPIESLTERGLMQRYDAANYGITPKGRAVLRQEEKERDGAVARISTSIRNTAVMAETLHVDMTIANKRILFDLTFDPNFVADVNTRDFLNHNGACEPEVVHLMRRVLREGDLAIDGGANIGFMTMIMSRLVGEKGRVEAFEPSTINYKKLMANLTLNSAENVFVVNSPLWSENRVLVSLHQGVDSGSSSLMSFNGALNTLPCRSLTLDSWFEMYDQTPRFLKLDIEGAEWHALIGAQVLLERGIDFISCELNQEALDRFGTTQMDLRDFMREQGYDTFLLHEDGSRPLFVGYDQEIIGLPANGNILFSKEALVREVWEQVL